LETEITEGDLGIYASSWVNIFNEDGTTFNDGYNEFAAEVSEHADNAYAMAGWIAAHFFVEGLKRVGEDELTWDSYIDAMEEEPVENPMGGSVDFSNGQRVGTLYMGLLEATVGEDGEGNATYSWANLRSVDTADNIVE
jgi:hypothetical protein